MENGDSQKYLSVLSSDVKITGKISFKKNLVVDGEVDGRIESKGDLIIGDNASVKGEVEASSVTVYGAFEGNLSARERLILKASSTFDGDLTARSLSIEEGAGFSGNSVVGKSKPETGKPATKQEPAPDIE